MSSTVSAADAEQQRLTEDARWAKDPHWRSLVLFYEYFHGDNAGGVGAPHQTGWTALVIRTIKNLARHCESPA